MRRETNYERFPVFEVSPCKSESSEGWTRIVDYPLANPFELWAAIAASQWRIPAIEQATRKANLGAAPAYSYIYSWRTPILNKRPGTFHAREISFAFDNAEICDHYSAGEPGAFVRVNS